MRSFALRLAGLLSLLAVAACDVTAPEPPLTIDATGLVVGLVYLDRDGDQKPTANVDLAIPGARVSLLVRGTTQSVARAVADANGAYALPTVPVGSYQVVVDSGTLGDSIRLVRIDPAEVTVSAHDTATVTVTLGYRVIRVAEARRTVSNKRISVEGVALNGWGAFGDSTVHLADSTGTIRALGVRTGTVAAGDSVRVLAEVGVEEGQPVLLDATLFTLARSRLPAPAAVTTAAAAQADGGRLDAAAVRVAGASIIDAATTATGDVRLRVDDGSGTLDVVIDQSARITSEQPILPGARLDAEGVLVPNGRGGWMLKPRTSRDLTVTVSTLRISELRRTPLDRLVAVEGVALNGWSTYGDSTVHLSDATGTIRVVRVSPAFSLAGDSVRVVGLMGIRNGQPVVVALAGVPLSILGRRQPPAPDSIGTGAASTASTGRLDAALVRVIGTVATDTATLANGDVRLHLDDGTGRVEVLLSANVGGGIRVLPGARLGVTGLLVPLSGGRGWVLKPRSPDDVAAAPAPGG